MYTPAELAPRPAAVGTGDERELGNGEFSTVGSLPPARGWTGASQGPLQSQEWEKTQD